MGPFLLVDKSFIQSLSIEEINFLDRHFCIVISPVLLYEIRANLLKHPDDPELSREKVILLAKKVRKFDTKTVDRFELLCHAELLGAGFQLMPQIPRCNGKIVITEDGKKGVIYEESYEKKLLRKWANGDFDEEDIEEAEKFIKGIKSYDLEKSREIMAKEFPRNKRFSSYEELSKFIDTISHITAFQWSLIESKINALGLPETEKEIIRNRWLKVGEPLFKDFSPYSYYCWRLNSIFWVGITSGLISTSKKSKSHIDYQYLFYLPFTHVFCSKDKFHGEFSEYFLRADQDFIWGDDLRKDLGVISSCYRKMTKKEKAYYEKNFGHYPPPIQDSITNKLWQKHMRPWTPRSGNLAIDMPEEKKKKMAEKIKRIIDAYEKSKRHRG